jgi:hypothetical protein
MITTNLGGDIMKKIIFAVLILGAVTGCQPAIIASSMRASDRENGSMETRCETADMRDASEIKQATVKYDGWRMVYVSEYTTGNRFGTVGVICFERPYKGVSP